ncbi:MAG: HEPN domain-containing protein [candidate division Zixibacteria bacterium]|nr:HEPN domain-containing protein [Candidatus Tariuqbacter arcticus]
MCPLSDNPFEWLEQAELDIETAEHTAKGIQRYYALFFCHLSVEKALKGLYFKRLGVCPPKTHNLPYLLEKIDEKPPEDIFKFIMKLSEVHIVTRYPEDIGRIQREFSSDFISFAIEKSKETIQWIKTRF